MSFRRRLARSLRRLGYVQRALESQADLTPLQDRRLLVAVVLMFVQLLVGWPLITALSAAAAALGAPEVALVGAPAAYATSWVLLGIAIWMGGKPAVKVQQALNQRAAAAVVRYLDGAPGV